MHSLFHVYLASVSVYVCIHVVRDYECTYVCLCVCTNVTNLFWSASSLRTVYENKAKSGQSHEQYSNTQIIFSLLFLGT